MTDDHRDIDGLGAYFDAVRRVRPPLSDAALDRMTAQALEVQAELSNPTASTGSARRNPFKQAIAAFGGWPAMAGLACAGVAGIWIGAVPPVGIVNLAADLGAVSNLAEDDLYLVDPVPDYTLTLALTEVQ